MNQGNTLNIKSNECDELARSIIDRICIPFNREANYNDELRTLGTVFTVMGIGLKDIMKDELYKDPIQFIPLHADNNPIVTDQIKLDIFKFSRCIKNNKNNKK